MLVESHMRKKKCLKGNDSERETALEAALENMNIECQAHHGNVFLANHCVIVLNCYLELTSVINDHPKYADQR